jgi:putative oxidoreductase
MKYAVLFGRILFAFIFIMAAPEHFTSETIQYAAAAGVPFASIAVPLSGVMALLGGLSVAIGYKAKWGALLLFLFLIPVTIMMHNFWAVQDQMMAKIQSAMFFKNAALAGTALLISYFGAGPLSVDAWLETRTVSIENKEALAS